MKKKRKPHFLIAGGPTREYIDPVRYLSNASTGLMAQELVRKARSRGFQVTFVRGPVAQPRIPKVKTVDVVTAAEMLRALRRHYAKCDILIMAAAVTDFRVRKPRQGKIKKDKSLHLELVKNVDIAKSLARGKTKSKTHVGFALESRGLLKKAQTKLAQKKFDLIVANAVTRKDNPFGSGAKKFYIIDYKKRTYRYFGYTKKQLAAIIIDSALRIW